MKYKNVYFRISCPLYRGNWGIGFQSQEDKELFYKTVKDLFLNDGWEIKNKKYLSSSGCPRVIKNKQELYLHPDMFNGVVVEDNIQYIEQLIKTCGLLSYRCADVYEEVFDITDEEYLKILESKQTQIKQDILTIYKTKRSNLYITDTWTPLNRVLNKYKIKRLSHFIGVVSSNDIDIQWIIQVFEKLINEGKIVTAECKNGTGYRTINKTEQKALKICLA